MERARQVRDTSDPETLDLDRADAYGRSFSDVYDTWYSSVSDAEATARFVAARSHGPVLELGVGSGRLARPMARLGLPVVGLDGSAAMLDRCQQTAGPDVHLVMADMRALPFGHGAWPDAGFDSALIAFNTLFNLGSEVEQRALLRELRGLLTSDGSLIVEALDVSPLLDGPSHSLGVRALSENSVVVTATELDKSTQVMQGRHLEISNDGLIARPWRLRWLTPHQLDKMAATVGLVLTERYRSWDEAPFTDGADLHVSVYRQAEPQPDPAG